MGNIKASLLRHHGQCCWKLACHFGDGLSFVSRSLTGNTASKGETPVPPKCANETRVPPTPLMSDEFVSAQTVALLSSAAKSRNVRRNPHELKDKNMRYINCLVRGGGGPANKLSLRSRACCCEETGSWRYINRWQTTNGLWQLNGRRRMILDDDRQSPALLGIVCFRQFSEISPLE